MSELRDGREGSEFNPVAMLNERADASAQRAAGYKKLANAWPAAKQY